MKRRHMCVALTLLGTAFLSGVAFPGLTNAQQEQKWWQGTCLKCGYKTGKRKLYNCPGDMECVKSGCGGLITWNETTQPGS
jgi:hypothetical protein